MTFTPPVNFNKPGPNKRVCAFLIDTLLAQLIAYVITIIFTDRLHFLIWALLILLRDIFDGQSIGKRLVGIQCLGKDGTPAKTLPCVVRSILMIIPIIPVIEYFFMRFDNYGRRLGDKMAKTVVTNLKPDEKDYRYLWLSLLVLLVSIVLQLALTAVYVALHPEAIKQLAH